MSRISLVDGKRAGQKVQRKIAVAVQKVKSPLLFVPLFWNQQQIVNNHSFSFNHQTDQGKETEGFEREVLEMER